MGGRHGSKPVTLRRMVASLDLCLLLLRDTATGGPVAVKTRITSAMGLQVWGYIEMLRSFNLDLSVRKTNLRRLILLFIPSVTVKHCILYKYHLVIYQHFL